MRTLLLSLLLTLPACLKPVNDDGPSNQDSGTPNGDDTAPTDDTADDTGTPVDADGDGVPASEDCDDNDADVHPGAAELCDGVDNDCDEEIDEPEDAPVWYADGDGDGFGDPGDSVQACDAPTGYVADATDCDDTDAAVRPGVNELCNGVDDDCDGETDEDAIDADTWYQDTDGDGFGDADAPRDACEQPSGFVENDEDCDDATAAVNPGAREVFDGLDNDCDGEPDVFNVADVAGWTVVGENGADGLADAVLVTEDLDGDGDGELVLGVGQATSSDDGILGLHDLGVAGLDVALTDGYAIIHGQTSNDHAGAAVTLLGDLDQDGNDELVLGVPFGNDDKTDCGDVYVFEVVGLTGRAQPDDLRQVRVRGKDASEYVGTSLAAGDVDQDGLPDLWVGAPGDEMNKGAAHLVFGNSGLTHEDRKTDQTDYYVKGDVGGDGLGTALRVVGDVLGDGTTATLMCAGAEATNGSDAGACYVVAGGALSGHGDARNVAEATIRGAASGDGVGLWPGSVTSGDFDGDTVPDLAIGVPGDDTSTTDGGAVWVFLGGALSGALEEGDADLVLYGDGALGAAVTLDGDVDSDGQPDLLMGAPSRNGSGSVYLIYGGTTGGPLTLPADQHARWDAEASGDRLGASLGGMADLDGDGTADFAVAAPGHDGQRWADGGKVYVLSGY
ncbi:MAG: FG-GAP repeat protein [Alphaproteobacteria bacterium]|nr:FG-GAP repeat protein [Alphaproteobacteria bacterium]